MPLENMMEEPRTSDAPVPEQAEYEAAFDVLMKQKQKDNKSAMNDDEAKKFRTAFGDPKFREIMADYMEEISDPKHRVETEQYITQLEQDDQVPAGKELVRPEACFVVKTRLLPEAAQSGDGAAGDGDGEDKGEKVFINVVQSERIAKPVGAQVAGGTQWSLPISLGPRRMESDKKGGTLVQTFDACFHPEALSLAKQPANKGFKDYLVHTAMEHVEESLWRLKPKSKNQQPQKDKLSTAFHVLKGVSYKNGTPAIMMMAKEGFADAQSRQQSLGSQGDKASGAGGEVPASVAQAAARLANQASKAASSSKGDKATVAAKGGAAAAAVTATKPNSKDGVVGKGENKKMASPALSAGKGTVKKGFLNQSTKSATSSSSSSSSASPTPAAAAAAAASAATGKGGDLLTERTTKRKQPPPPRQEGGAEGTMAATSTAATAVAGDDGGSNRAAALAGAGAAGGVVVPTYRLKERGQFHISNHMNDRVVQPTRPLEIEVAIELPSLPSSHSEMDLDVSTHRLLFTANRVAVASAEALLASADSSSNSGSSGSGGSSYRLELALPYPCDGEKGKAKFDKRAKELKITIPVLPPQAVTQDEIIGRKVPAAAAAANSSSGDGGGGAGLVEELPGQEEESAKGEAVDDDDDDEAAAAAAASASSKAVSSKLQPEKHHNTFLDNTTARATPESKGDDEKKGGDGEPQSNPLTAGRMKFDLPPHATLVRQQKQIQPPDAISTAVGAGAAGAGGTSAAAAAAPPPLVVSRKAFDAKGQAFVPSSSFQGACPGCVFKLGASGLGYYLEATSEAGDDAEGGDEEEDSEEEEEEEGSEEAEAEDSEQQQQQQVGTTTTATTSEAAALTTPATPRFEYRQMEGVVTVLVQVSRIVKGSVVTEFKDKSAAITFTAAGTGTANTATDTAGEEGEEEGVAAKETVYRLLLLPPNPSAGSSAATPSSSSSSSTPPVEYKFDPSSCRFDAADKNMIVVLGKAKDCQGLWTTNNPPPPPSSTPSSSSLFAVPSPADLALAFPPPPPPQPLAASSAPPQPLPTKKKKKKAKGGRVPLSNATADDGKAQMAAEAAAVAASKYAIEGAAAARASGGDGLLAGQRAAGMTSSLPAPSLALPYLHGSSSSSQQSAEPKGAAPSDSSGYVAPTAFKNSLIFELD